MTPRARVDNIYSSELTFGTLEPGAGFNKYDRPSESHPQVKKETYKLKVKIWYQKLQLVTHSPFIYAVKGLCHA